MLPYPTNRAAMIYEAIGTFFRKLRHPNNTGTFHATVQRRHSR